jgi:hypothetical protein
VRIWSPVRVTVGNTSTGGFIVGPRSSCVSQAMAASTKSELARYGKNELETKSASPATTMRNGERAASFNFPSAASATILVARADGGGLKPYSRRLAMM